LSGLYCWLTTQELKVCTESLSASAEGLSVGLLVLQPV